MLVSFSIVWELYIDRKYKLWYKDSIFVVLIMPSHDWLQGSVECMYWRAVALYDDNLITFQDQPDKKAADILLQSKYYKPNFLSRPR